jgi:hypothetical protein
MIDMRSRKEDEGERDYIVEAEGAHGPAMHRRKKLQTLRIRALVGKNLAPLLCRSAPDWPSTRMQHDGIHFTLSTQ